MGWFAIACICGFLGFWGRRPLSNWLARTCKITSNDADILAVIIAFTILLAGLVLWSILLQNARTFGQIAEAFGHGAVARFLFGLILGVGTAFVAAERSRVQSDNRAPSAPAAAGSAGGEGEVGGGAPPDGGGSSTLRTHLVLSTGLVITLLALAAPHLDRWFSRLTALKSPLIELQVTSVATHKVSVGEGLEAYNDALSLGLLAGYSNRIGQDIEYLEKYGRNVSTSSAKKLLPAFATIISPIARCVQTAIDQGLSIESARQMIRPTADLLLQIIFAEDALRARGELSAKT